MRATDRHGRPLELTKIAGSCDWGPCPAAYSSDAGTVGVQGYVLHVPGAPPGKALVELPLAVLLEAARALTGH